MPTTKTAEKEMRVAQVRKERNKANQSETKTKVTKAVEAIAGGNLETAKTKVKDAVKALDKQVGKGRVHPNSAARRKSRLVKKLNKAAAAPKAEKK